MTLIDVSDIKNISKLLAEENCHYPLLKSMLYGKLEAKIYIDNLENPTVLLVIGENGWCYQIGNTHDHRINQWICSHIVSLISEYKRPILWFGIPLSQRYELDRVRSVEIRDYPRYRFEFNQTRFELNSLNEIEYIVEEITESNIEKIARNYGEFEVFWPDLDAFLDSGLGFVAISNGGIIGHAISASVNDREVEIDLFTNEEYRGKGISTHLVYRLIEKCYKNNLIPKWDCAITNEASIKLAISNGFNILEKYPFSYIVEKPNQNIV